LTKPRQTKPNAGSWRLWSNAIGSFTTDGKTLSEQLRSWTKDHSKNRRWNSYNSNTNHNKVYKCRYNEEDAHRNWEQYEWYGTELRLQNEVDIDDFSPTNGTPIRTNELTNRRIYEELPDIILPGQTISTPQINSQMTWEDFLATKPLWIQSLLDPHDILPDM
jgi:hypothetical protein